MNNWLAAFVLAGGKSSRMGSDKALLTWGSKTLLEQALSSVRELGPDVCIVGSAEKFGRFGSVVEDIYPERGPLGGIHAALRGSEREFNLMLAVDLPLMGVGFLRFLCEQAQQSEAVITVPRIDGTFQPLCAVYRRSFADAAERALEEGRNKIGSVFDSMEMEVLDIHEIENAGFSRDIFLNVNTREEWEQLRVRAGRKRET